MKTRSLLLLVLLLTAVISVRAQSKKDVETNLIGCTKAKDSIQKAYTDLSAIHKSVNKAYLAYDSMYRVIKEKVFLADFNPVRMPVLLDSLKATRNLEFSGQTTILKDTISILRKSISVLNNEIILLNAKIDGLAGKEAEKTKAVSDLKLLKELLDGKIITQEEFDAKKTKLLEKL
jgi:hypothetical protein